MKPNSGTRTPTTGTEELIRQLRRQREDTWQALRNHVHEARLSEGLTVRDDADASEADVQSELGAALMQMETETLVHVDAALDRVAAGTYGRCAECDGEISIARLRALPFAMRCRECEEDREGRQGRVRRGPVLSYVGGLGETGGRS